MKARTHPLRLWLAQQGTTLAEFAAEIGASQSYLSECVTGAKQPSPQFIARIRAATRGRVKAEHFIKNEQT
jgi:DNA-binding transcriptional regulator YdaS (Cro superfamily)